MELNTNVYIKESDQDGVPETHLPQHQEPVGQKWDKGKQQWFAMPLELLEPLADVFEAGVAKGYELFNCLNPFKDSDRRFWNATMRHLEACQIDPLAIDKDIKDKYGLEVYHSAQVAFNMLLRIRNADIERRIV